MFIIAISCEERRFSFDWLKVACDIEKLRDADLSYVTTHYTWLFPASPFDVWIFMHF